MKHKESDVLYSEIEKLIASRKSFAVKAVNTSMVLLYWEIGQTICQTILNGSKAEYGYSVVEEVSEKLMQNYGKGFKRASLFRMIQFFREFPEKEKVATLSRQLSKR